MIELHISQVRHMAGIAPSDNEFEQEVKFWGWIGDSKYRVVDAGSLDPERDRARNQGVEILIIKE